MPGKRALITCITCQDGSYLAELLLKKGYSVHGLIRRSSHAPFERIRHLLDRIELMEADLADQASLDSAVDCVRPHEVYNLAAPSFVPSSWRQPELTGAVGALGVTRLLEAVRRSAPRARFYQASSSEMFGKAERTPQDESTPFHPRSPYGVAKCYGHFITVNYRECYGLFACSGICFNHESPRRGPDFVTRKISLGAARVKLGLIRELRIGNLDAKRDWGFAGDTVDAMWRMLQQDEPRDYVIATRESHSVREFAKLAFSLLGLDWKRHVKVDKTLLRPAEVCELLGDPSKAARELGWRPKVRFRELVQMMVQADLEMLRRLEAS